MKICFPDYGNCSVNLASSLLAHFGAAPEHATLPALDALLNKQYKNIVLMLFDGMGMDVLSRHLPEDGFLRAHVARELSAAFPSTTVAATTTIESGNTPIEHAWLGWTLYFDEIGKSVDVFLNTEQGTKQKVAEYSVVRSVIPYRTIFDKLSATGNVTANYVGQFSGIRIDTLDGLFDTALRLCKAPGRQYVYTYWGEPDHTMHDKGVTPPEVGDILRDIESRVRAFCGQVGEDTLVMLTADHGLLDTTPVYLCDHPELVSALLRRPTVEPRAAAFYVKEEYMESFPELFRAAVGDAYLLMPSDEAISRGLFGDGAPHEKARGYLGDFFAIATTEKSLYWDRNDHGFIGMHAGLTEAEMRVPLIVAKS